MEVFDGNADLVEFVQRAVGYSLTGLTGEQVEEVVEKLQAAGLRAEGDLRNEKINYKVREHSLAKVPVILVVGGREAEEKKVAMRRLGGEKQEFLALDAALATLINEARAPSS